MVRPRKYQDGAKGICITLSPEVFEAIKDHPNRSGYIDNLIRFDLAMNRTDEIDSKLEELNDKAFSLDKDKLAVKKEINALEAQKNALQRMKDNSLNERLKVVETFVSRRSTETDIRAWFESRTDKLKDCNFSTPKEATEWVKTRMAR